DLLVYRRAFGSAGLAQAQQRRHLSGDRDQARIFEGVDSDGPERLEACWNRHRRVGERRERPAFRQLAEAGSGATVAARPRQHVVTDAEVVAAALLFLVDEPQLDPRWLSRRLEAQDTRLDIS